LNKGEKLVEVYKAAGEAEAQIIKGLLESNDIPVSYTHLTLPTSDLV